MPSSLAFLECSKRACGHRSSFSTLANLCPTCHAPLLARYHLDVASKTLNPESLLERPPTMWRYEEVLPPGPAVSLGEGVTPLVRAPGFGKQIGLDHLRIKDEGQNPTGSFKARGLSAAVTVAKNLGAWAIALPTAGNAGGAAAAYAARAGIGCVVAMPVDTPQANVIEARAFGADVRLIDGLISDCGAYIAGNAESEGWFEVSTLKEPYRIEGKKTMGYELWEDLDGALPDVIVYPAGGGVGLIGMWKAFDEMEALGWIGSERPRMVVAQASGCAPIVRAFDESRAVSEFWPEARTVASGLRVPKALGDFLILEALYASRGAAVEASDEEMMAACRDLARLEGIFAAPEGGAGLVAAAKLRSRGAIEARDSVVVFNTGSGYKYLEAWQSELSP